MPQTLAEMIRDLEERIAKRVITETPVSKFVQTLPREKLRETLALIEKRLAEPDKKKPASRRTTHRQRKT